MIWNKILYVPMKYKSKCTMKECNENHSHFCSFQFRILKDIGSQNIQIMYFGFKDKRRIIRIVCQSVPVSEENYSSLK